MNDKSMFANVSVLVTMHLWQCGIDDNFAVMQQTSVV